MRYSNIDEDDVRLHSGIIGARKSAIIEADGYEKRSERKAGLTERTNWKKVQSKRMKAIQKAKAINENANAILFEDEIEDAKEASENLDTISLEEAIKAANESGKIIIIDKNGEMSYIDAELEVL